MFDMIEKGITAASEAGLRSYAGPIAQVIQKNFGEDFKRLSVDDQWFKEAMTKLYPYLPQVIRTLVPEENFVNFAIGHRQLLIDELQKKEIK